MDEAASVRREPGTYVLLLEADCHNTVQAGAVGDLEIYPGWYAYVGSAFGPGGVRARVQRHVEGRGRRHWHVDYLREATTVESIWFTHDELRRECSWARTLGNLSGATVPLEGFGASDCGCPTHLLSLPTSFSLSDFRERIESEFPGHARIERLQPAAVRAS